MSESVKFSKFTGINNLLKPWELGRVRTADGSYVSPLVSALDCDINRAQKIVIRPGKTLGNSTPTKWLWSTKDQTQAFGIQNGNLVSLNADLSANILAYFGDSRVWFTETNGTVYCTNGIRIGQISGGVYTDFNPTLKTLESVLPPGENIEYYAGRLYVAVGPVLWFSEAFRLQVRYQKDNFKVFPSDITMIAVADDGLYVSAGLTYFLQGKNPHKFGPLTSVLSFESYKGMKTYLPGNLYSDGSQNDLYPVWVGSGGLCVGLNGGQVTNLTGQKYNVPQGSTGAGVIRTSKNGNHFIGVVR